MRTSRLLPIILFTAITSSALAEKVQSPGGSGVLCAAALMSVSVEVGKHCLPGYNPDGLVRLQRNLTKLENYMLQHPDWDQQKLLRFKERQGAVGQEKSRLCEAANAYNGIMELAKGYIDIEATKLDASIVELTARPGKPAWGDCI